MNNEKALLKLVNIKKDYILANNEPVHALKGITLNFRKNEFVSILGPSGCGKTTLLNIIGGLDKYSDGDLIIVNKSTKKYKDKDWDIYRNHRIGFIFQSYNLIMHQTILENVELALTISGINKKERVIKAKEALDKVGLKDMYNKKPNQLSGGQCQRGAIARALVNEPDILLADEPTGALDSVTSKQIMDLISEISKEKLVIMVTHNPELASIYSTRIIKLLDGNVVSDSNVLNDSNEDVSFTKSNEKAKMSFPTAFKLSARNLLTKWKRTLLVCIAGSIGIVGVSTVLSVSAGVHQYIDSMQDDMLSGNPITISQTGYDLNAMMNQSSPMDKIDIAIKNGYVNVNSMIKYLLDQSKSMDSFKISNDITKDYIDFVLNMDKDSYAAMTLDYGISLDNNVYTTWNYNNTSEAKRMSVSAITKMYTSVLEKTSFNKYATYIEQLNSGFAQAPNNNDYILSQYDILSGDIAKNEDEIMIVVSKNTRLTDVLLAQLGYYTQEEFINLVNNISKDENVYDHLDDNKLQFTYDELINKEFVFYTNNVVFNKNEGITKELSPFTYNAYVDENFTDGIKLKVAGILRPKDDISYGCLDIGFYYTEALSKRIIKENINSDIINYYKEKKVDTITSGEFTTEAGISVPTGLTFKYDYIYEGVTYKDNIGYVGNESSMSSFMSLLAQMMGGSSSTANNKKYYDVSLRQLGGNDLANNILIFPKTFDSKYKVTDYLDTWNNEGDIEVNGKTISYNEREKVTYSDNLELIINMINTMIDIVTYALIVFTALSLLVSTVMIGIITYVSVVERTKEIGVIRSIGGRKKDVSYLFNAETFIIGSISGVLGIVVTGLISLLINIVVNHLTNINTIAILRVQDAVVMILISIALTLISGLIPAKAAARKNPVDALRSE